MIALSSVDQLARAIRGAREVTLGAYILHPGRLMNALKKAAAQGVRLHVRVEAQPYRNDGGAKANLDAVARLRAEGVDAVAVQGLHFKGAVVDRRLFLDDRNWTDRGGDTVLRDDQPRDVRLARAAILGRTAKSDAQLAATKSDALDLERDALGGAPMRGIVEVATESFSFGPQIYATLAHLARSGRRVRLLVERRDLAQNPAERTALLDLARDGVDVRAGASTEKFAIAGDNAWVGSANATYGVADQRDWGLRTHSRPIVQHLRATFRDNWGKSSPLA